MVEPPHAPPLPSRLNRAAELRWRRGRRPRRAPTRWRALPARLPVTFAIGFVTLVFFALEYALGGTTDTAAQLRLGALRPDRVLEHGELYRLMMPMVLHHGPFHLVMNGLAFLQLMMLTEHLYGSARALAFYLICGVTGALATTTLAPDWIGGSLGASGAIMGLAGLLLGATWYGQEPWRGRLRALFGRRLAFGVALTFVIGIGLSFVLPIIDNWAHGGGFVGGLILAGLHRDPRRREGPVARAAAGLLLVAWLGSAGWAAWDGGAAVQRLPQDNAALMARRAALHDDGLRAAIYLAESVRAHHRADQATEGRRLLRDRLRHAQAPDTPKLVVAQLFDEPRYGREVGIGLERWLQLAPDDPEALNATAWHLVTRQDDRRDPARAEALSRRSLALLGPGDHTQRGAYLDTLAESLYQLGRYEEALGHQEEAVRLGTRQRMAELPEMRERLQRIRAAQDGG